MSSSFTKSKAARVLARILMLMLLTGSSVTAFAEDATTIITKRMQIAEVLRGQFAQEKYFSIMTRPFKSSGTFTLHQQKGIWWHNNSPIPGDMVIGDKGILQRSASGATQRIDSAQQPALNIMTDIIRQLVSGDWQQLSKHFDIAASTTTEEWSATLTPKPDSLFDHYARTVELKGQAYVSAITINEKSGDKTQIQFSGLSSDTRLQTSEVDAFSW